MRCSVQWALSSLDCEVHLLGGCHTQDALQARCGEVLPPLAAIQHDQPPPGPPCERCSLVFLSEFRVPSYE